MDVVAIDASTFVRKGKKGSFKACLGSALTIENETNFDQAYFEVLEKVCKKYNVESKRRTLKAAFIYSLFGGKAFQAINDVFESLLDHVKMVNFYYTYLSTKKTPVVRLYGSEKSGIEEVPTLEFINKISPAYPHYCAWKYVMDAPSNDFRLQLDYFEGEVTKAWQVIENANLNVFYAGDEIYPSLATADIFLRVLDERMSHYNQYTKNSSQKALLTKDCIETCFHELEEKGKLRICYLGERELKYLVPFSKKMINASSKIKRPLIFVVAKAPPEIKHCSEFIRVSPLWNLICEFAYQKQGCIKFIDFKSDEDRKILSDGGIAICIGKESRELAAFSKELMIDLEIVDSEELKKLIKK